MTIWSQQCRSLGFETPRLLARQRPLSNERRTSHDTPEHRRQDSAWIYSRSFMMLLQKSQFRNLSHLKSGIQIWRGKSILWPIQYILVIMFGPSALFVRCPPKPSSHRHRHTEAKAQNRKRKGPGSCRLPNLAIRPMTGLVGRDRTNTSSRHCLQASSWSKKYQLSTPLQ